MNNKEIRPLKVGDKIEVSTFSGENPPPKYADFFIHCPFCGSDTFSVGEPDRNEKSVQCMNRTCLKEMENNWKPIADFGKTEKQMDMDI